MSDVDLVGNVTRDPELRFTPGGVAVCSFGFAVNRRIPPKAGQSEWTEKTSFFDVVAWNTLAENVSESVHRGDRVMVAGRLEQRSWETQDGEKRSKVEIAADEIGHSLRWATTDVTKNPRRDSAGGGYTNDNGGGGGTATQTRPAPRNEAPAYDYDEEPFALDAFAMFDRYGHGLTKYQA